MSGRKWLPSLWADESTPSLGATPDVFIDRKVDGTYQLRVLEDDRDPDGIDQFGVIALAPGVVVNFLYTTPMRSLTIDVASDGTWTSTDDLSIPANCFRDDDAEDEDIWDNLDEMVRESRANDPDYEGRRTIDAWFWSSGTNFRFDIVDGKPTLTEAGAVQ